MAIAGRARRGGGWLSVRVGLRALRSHTPDSGPGVARPVFTCAEVARSWAVVWIGAVSDRRDRVVTVERPGLRSGGRVGSGRSGHMYKYLILLTGNRSRAGGGARS